jgi:hypothetical protein
MSESNIKIFLQDLSYVASIPCNKAITTYSYYNNLDCLQMADESNCLKFISLPSVQNLVSSVWNGQISYKSGLLYNVANKII